MKHKVLIIGEPEVGRTTLGIAIAKILGDDVQFIPSIKETMDTININLKAQIDALDIIEKPKANTIFPIVHSKGYDTQLMNYPASPKQSNYTPKKKKRK